MAAAFRREVPTDFHQGREPSKSRSPSKERGYRNIGSGIQRENKFDTSARFNLKPKAQQTCKKHRASPVEFVCAISGEFFCRLCAPSHEGHDDQSMAVSSNEIQEQMTQLKHTYLSKRTHVIDRLHEHQNTIEDFFRIFTETVDQHRQEVLKEEYLVSEKMEHFERRMKSLLHRTQNYSMVEFYFE